MVFSVLYLTIFYNTLLTGILVFVIYSIRKERSDLMYRANTDGLSGLYRREKFVEALTIELEREKRLNEYGCLLLIDVDNFKKINDDFGHSQGDTVLRAIGGMLRTCKRSYDLVGRYGGEEFVVYLPGATLAGGANFSQRLRDSTKTTTSSFVSGMVTYSIGIASFPEDAKDVSSLLKKADEAMYRAKETKDAVYVGNADHRNLLMDYSNKVIEEAFSN